MGNQRYKFYTSKVVQSGSITEIYRYEHSQFKKIQNEENKRPRKKDEIKKHSNKKEHKNNDKNNDKNNTIKTNIYKREEKTIYRTKRNLKRLIYANINQRKETDKFITLTFKDKPTREDVFMKFKRFNGRLRKLYPNIDFQFISVLERGSKGTKRLHLHCLYFGLPYIKQKQLQDIWQYGIVNVKRVSDYYDVAKYVTKYLSKTYSDIDYIPMGKKAYTTSRGLNKPNEMYMNDDEYVVYLKDKVENKHIEYLYKNTYNNEYVGKYEYYKLKETEKGR